MNRFTRRIGFAATVAVLAGSAWALAQGPTAAELVGRALPDFALPSAADRLVRYEGDYYGKHVLILTFFPAAFTPV